MSLPDFCGQNYEHLFKINAETSHYIQSKVVRAKQRIEAEMGLNQRYFDYNGLLHQYTSWF